MNKATTPTLLLIDGSSYLYRAYHAMPDLRGPDGFPTGAIHGMVAMLKRALQDVQPEHAACVFDAKGDTFRNAWYPEYKAQRAPMPEDLVKQIEPIHEVVKLLGWPVLVPPGIEADDAIGTLARLAAASGHEVIISTGDKDLAQLVNEHVTLINTMSNERLDIAGVLAKFGVPPDRIVDYLTLIGDTVDNVPGVSKCGPKTALKWLTAYDTLDGVMANAAHVTGAVGQNLRDALEWLPKGRELITVKLDCDLSGHMVSIGESLVARAEDKPALLEFFSKYGFKTLLRELGAAAATGGPAATVKVALDAPVGGAASVNGDLFAEPVVATYETVTTEQQLDQWIALINAAELTAVDTETTSLEPMTAQLVGISLSVKAGEACYIPVAHAYQGVPQQLEREQVLARLKPWLEDASKLKVGQNLKYDSHILANHGVSLQGIHHLVEYARI